jgi:hypothetical protein
MTGTLGRAGAAVTGALALGLALALALAPSALAAGAPPAKGARLGDVVWGTAVAAILTILAVWGGVVHRRRGLPALKRLAAFSTRVSGLPGWAALPAGVAGGGLILAVFGFYWDVAKHIDTGRDPSPFGTPAHYPILAGLAGIALAGYLSIILGAPRSTTSLRITRDWHVPLGGGLIFLCGAFALSGFPLDDVWHSLFGQDVTLWGPTHVLMIAGASLATLGVWVLLVEGWRARRARGDLPMTRALRAFTRFRSIQLAGAFLLGLSSLQAEFDFGVPQFQLVYQPIMLMLAAGCGLVAARIYLGRFGALQAVGFYLFVRGLLTLTIGPVFGLSTLHFPLYLPEAVLVELVALAISPRRPITLGAVSGLLIGTVGLAAEWGWSHVWMPLPWPGSLLGQALALGLAAALAAGVLGGYVGRALTSERGVGAQRGPRWLLPLAAAVAVGVIAFPLPMTAGRPTRAALALATVQPPPHRTVAVRATLSPADAARHGQWLTVTAWQGGGLVVDRLRRVAPGTYETTRPIPVYGPWKAILRMENGRALQAVPIYLPEDSAIPAPGVSAADGVTRSFVRDKKILQREAVGGSAWLEVPAYLILSGIAALWLVALGLGLRRLEVGGGEPEGTRTRPKLGARAPSPA